MFNYLKLSLLIGLFMPLLLQAQESKTFPVGSFDGVKSSGSANVVLIQGNTESVVAEGSDDRIEKLDIYVKNDILVIGQKNNKNWNGNWSSSGSLTIYVTFKDIQELSLSGSGKISCDGNVDFDDLEVNLSGSGRIQLEGDVDDFDVSISGSGSIDAFELEAETVDARVSGSGNIKVYVTKKLEARVTGSGKVVYESDGNLNIDTKTTGSGSIRKR